MSKYKFKFVLIILFITSFLLRIYRIDTLPIYTDETGYYIGLNQIVRGPVLSLGGIVEYIYKILFNFAWLFGLNPLGVRISSAVFSSLIPLAMYAVSLKVKNEKKVAVIVAITASLIPWSYMIGRIGYTHIPMLLLLVLLHTYYYLKSESFKDIIASFLFLLASLFVYPSTVVMVPIVATLIFNDFLKGLVKQRRVMVYALLALLILVVSIKLNQRFNLFSSGGRGLDLAIWRDVNTTWETDKFRGLSWNSSPTIFSFFLPSEEFANKLVYNQVTANLSIFVKNYISFFSPDWLFLKGDAILRHSTGMVGAFYPFLLPFMVYGAFLFFKSANSKTRNLFLVWILVSPIPAAITKDGAGYLLRAVTMLPFLTYFCALGLVESLTLFRRSWRLPYGIALGLVATYSVWSFFYGYFHVYPALSARAYEYGFKELSDFQVANNGATLLIVWDGYYHMGDFFFWQNLPFSVYEQVKVTPAGYGQTTLWKTLPNLYFTNAKDKEGVQAIIKEYQPDYLIAPDKFFIKYPDEIIELTSEKIKEIPYPDKTTAFTIYSIR